jgi:hypothetical protein
MVNGTSDNTCPACGASPEEHDDRACPKTGTPGVVQRGRRGRRPKVVHKDYVDVPLDEGGPWDTSGTLHRVDGWPAR